MANTPKVAAMEVYPVAGKDCMELNLSGAHAPYFTRNIVVLTDDRGNAGIGEVPGGPEITQRPGEREAPGGGHQRGRLQDDPAEAQRVAHDQY